MNELKTEEEGLKFVLSNETAMRDMIIGEIEADVKKYGDDRRTLIEAAERVVAKTVSVPDEPCTVILSKNGWIRQRTGHEVDMNTLSFKDGDQLLAIAQTRTAYPVVVLDSGVVPTACLRRIFPVAAAMAYRWLPCWTCPQGESGSDVCRSAGYPISVQLVRRIWLYCHAQRPGIPPEGWQGFHDAEQSGYFAATGKCCQWQSGRGTGQQRQVVVISNQRNEGIVEREGRYHSWTK